MTPKFQAVRADTPTEINGHRQENSVKPGTAPKSLDRFHMHLKCCKKPPYALKSLLFQGSVSLQANTEDTGCPVHMQHRLLQHPTVHREETGTASQGSHELSLPLFLLTPGHQSGQGGNYKASLTLTHQDYSPQSHTCPLSLVFQSCKNYCMVLLSIFLTDSPP